MCLAALWSPVGKGAKAVVAGPAGAAFAGLTILAEYAFRRVSLSRFSSFFFELTSDFIQSCDNLLRTSNVAHVIHRPCQGVKTSSHRDMYGLWVMSRENLSKLHFNNKGSDLTAQMSRCAV